MVEKVESRMTVVPFDAHGLKLTPPPARSDSSGSNCVSSIEIGMDANTVDVSDMGVPGVEDVCDKFVDEIALVSAGERNGLSEYGDGVLVKLLSWVLLV